METFQQRPGRSITILLADDDEADREFVRAALEQVDFVAESRCVEAGQELVDYLRRSGADASPRAAQTPRPSIILLDLERPRRDGLQTLVELKADPALRRIPVVVLSASGDREDIRRAYDLGASSYITRPVTEETMRSVLTRVAEYWSQIVTLPDGPRG